MSKILALLEVTFFRKKTVKKQERCTDYQICAMEKNKGRGVAICK